MCGIVGFVGNDNSVPVILSGLEKLEYRGYDSAGLAVWSDQGAVVRRAVGKLENLRREVERNPLAGNLGIGHTRWATHGRPSEMNAHPHRYGGVTVVHNGIIENHRELRHALEAAGHPFSSETDTEIAAHLIHDEFEACGDLLEALRRALLRIEGSYALVVMHDKYPDRLVAARQMSPLVLGVGQGERILASDVPALISRTRSIIFIEDGDLIEIRKDSHRILDRHTGAEQHRVPKNITWTPAMAEKGGYKHFMLKEIFEQPRAIGDTIRSRILVEDADVVLDDLKIPEDRLTGLRKVQFIACGTSYHACLVGKYLMENLAQVPADAEIGSEFRYRDPLVSQDTLVVAISQSGETADTIAAVNEAKKKGAWVLTICNVLDASLPRLSHGTLYTHAGPEIGVASTKAFTTQLAAVYLLAVWMGRRKGSIDRARAQVLLDSLMQVPSLMEKCLEHSESIRETARHYMDARNMLFLGRNLLYPVALEGALKMKEISYIHAEGYPAGEMKHGPIALIDEHVPTVALAPLGFSYDKTLSNVQEVKARRGPVIAVASDNDPHIAEFADRVFLVPACDHLLSPMICVLPLQLFAYHMADLKGTDVDQPRNLAKSVTVE
jgi:glucosamine--fructose-6-phosphate aminotransferase (isomerizing)